MGQRQRKRRYFQRFVVLCWPEWKIRIELAYNDYKNRKK